MSSWGKHSKRRRALTVLVILFALAVVIDAAFARWSPVERSTLFVKNDYEKTLYPLEGQTRFTRVLFGNEAAASAYLSAESANDCQVFSLSRATLSDLSAMLEQEYLIPTAELIVLADSQTLLCGQESDPSYPWQRGVLEPYLWFQRGRICDFIQTGARPFLATRSLAALPHYRDLSLPLRHGAMTDAELDAQAAEFSVGWWQATEDEYAQSLSELDAIAAWCKAHQVRLRLIVAPSNDYAALPDSAEQALDNIAAQARQLGADVLDLRGRFPREYFYDLYQLNQEYGAYYFTQALDSWLAR